MAKDYTFTIDGHPSIYKIRPRKLKIYFSEPDKGVNKETGVLLFIAGFGGHANSNVYKKMRSKFADQYNLVTVQCDYFGWEFMQAANEGVFNISKVDLEKFFTPNEINQIYVEGQLNIQKLLLIGSNYNLTLSCKAKIDEDLTNFNDMGIMQALDNIAAILAVISILKDNQLDINLSKIITYGHSHGAYLSYLCNAFAPNLFSLLIDNSSWLFPDYLSNNRILYQKVGKAVLTTEFEYLGKKVSMDTGILSLPLLYAKFNNNCKVVCFHGTTDNLISHKEKKNFCIGINNCLYNEISQETLDGRIFKSTNHGLDADFLELFEYVVNGSFDFNIKKNIEHSVIKYTTDNYNYLIDYKYGLPILNVE